MFLSISSFSLGLVFVCNLFKHELFGERYLSVLDVCLTEPVLEYPRHLILPYLDSTTAVIHS
jgi:hypothetical protein